MYQSRVTALASCFVTLILVIASPHETAASDWPHWRGPEYNGISRETGLINDWNPLGGTGSNLLWKRDELGGRSTPIVLHGMLYTLVGTEAGEKVVCLDAATGKTLWENPFNVWLSDVPRERAGWSSVVGDPETGRVYALGVCGYFQCLDGESGKTLWSVPMHEKFGLLSTFGGRTNFPVICEDLVIVSAVVIGWGEMAKPTHRFIAFDKLTGEVVWFNGTRPLPYDTTYSTPTITVLAGQKAMVFGSGDGAIWAFQPRTGLPIWKFRFSRRGLNISPLVVGDRVYSGHSEENIVGTTMGSLVAIDATGHDDITESHELWSLPQLMMGKSSPILVDGRLYGVSDGAKLFVVDAETGKHIGRRRGLPLRSRRMRGSPLYADGKIYLVTEDGQWCILKPDEKRGARFIRRGKLPDGAECHTSPICSRGRIYIQSTGPLYCLEDSGQEHGYADRPTPSPESPVEVTPDATHVQLIPAEVLMQPGGQQKFTVHLFNARGQLLRESAADFLLDGAGDISDDGIYTAPSSNKHGAVMIRAQVGDIVGRARIRVVPPLPWRFDFEDVEIDPRTSSGEPMITWVGARYRHVVRNADDNHVMVKITTIPKGARSRCWFGHPELHDYTIQADVRGAVKDKKLPDIGLIAQGYTLDLRGDHQDLQIRTWGTDERMARSVDFPWEPDRWYTMKFRAAGEANQAILKGKVWPRDETEPKEWSIEASDHFPNRTGSPGLFGNAEDAEIMLDNIIVSPN